MSILTSSRRRAVRASAAWLAFSVSAVLSLVAGSAGLLAQDPPPAPATPQRTAPAAMPPAKADAAGFTETPAERDARMAWFREARFGMFIHWGVYSELAGQYDGKPASGTGEWIFQNAKPPMSKYEETARRFDPVKYDPVAWAALAKEAGMKYVVITSKHHDGFCLWDSASTDWDVSRTPQGKDLLAPLAAACKDAGLRFGLYFTIMDWHHADYAPRRAWNDLHAAHGPPVFERFVPYVHAQLEEIVQRFDPALLWFDGEWEDTWTVEHGAALEAKLRALKPSILMNNRVGKSRNDMAGLDRPGVKKAGDYGTPEQEVPARGLPGVDWETCMTMNDTWGYRVDDPRWKSAGTLIRTLSDVASKGGNFLLNVGPTGKGEIPPESIARLKAIGAWMSVNGEAIYGTDASPFERLPFGRATRKGDRTIYLHVFERPAGGTLRIPGLKSAPHRVSVLGDSAAAAKSELTSEGLVLSIGDAGAGGGDVTVVKLEFAAPFVVDPTAALPRPSADGSLRLGPDDAIVHDGTLCTERFPTGDKSKSLGCWTDPKTWISFDALLPQAGRYRVELDYACAPGSAGSEVVLGVDGSRIGSAVNTASTGAWTEFGVIELGVVDLLPGRRSLELRALKKVGEGVLNLRAVRLVPVTSAK